MIYTQTRICLNKGRSKTSWCEEGFSEEGYWTVSQRRIRNLPGGEGKAPWERMCLDRGLKGPGVSTNQESGGAEAGAA